MTLDEMIPHFRELAGEPNTRVPSDAEVQVYLTRALRFVMDQLEVPVVDADVALIADQYEYPLPAEFLRMLHVVYGNKFLAEASLGQWKRDAYAYWEQESGTPVAYAISGNTLYLTPPPSAAVIADASTLALRYACSGDTVAGLGVQEHYAAVYQAVSEWAIAHPGEENGVRGPAFAQRAALAIQAAKSRRSNPTEPGVGYARFYHRRGRIPR